MVLKEKLTFVILATGFEIGCIPYFPTIGRNQTDISQLWKAHGSIGYPQTYFGIMAPDLPNYFFIMQVCNLRCHYSSDAKAHSSTAGTGEWCGWHYSTAMRDHRCLHCQGYQEGAEGVLQVHLPVFGSCQGFQQSLHGSLPGKGRE